MLPSGWLCRFVSPKYLSEVIFKKGKNRWHLLSHKFVRFAPCILVFASTASF